MDEFKLGQTKFKLVFVLDLLFNYIVEKFNNLIFEVNCEYANFYKWELTSDFYTF